MNKQMIKNSIGVFGGIFSMLLDRKPNQATPNYLSETHLTIYAQNNDSMIQTWLFFCRAQRFLLQSGGIIQVDEVDNQAVTEQLLIGYLKNLSDLPEDILDIINNDDEASQIIYFTMSQFKSKAEVKYLILNCEWFKSKAIFNYLIDDRCLRDSTGVANHIHHQRRRIMSDNFDNIHQLIKSDLENDVIIPFVLKCIETINKLSSVDYIPDSHYVSIPKRNENMDEFYDDFINYFRNNYEAITKHRAFSLMIKNNILEWLFNFIQDKKFQTSKENYDLFIKLYASSSPSPKFVTVMFERRFLIIGQLLSLGLYQRAFEMEDNTISRHYILTRIPPERLRFVALLSYLKDIEYYISTVKFKFKFKDIGVKPVEFLKNKTCPSELKHLFPDAIYNLLLQVHERFSQDIDIKQKDSLIDIYKQLELFLTPKQQQTLKEKFKVNEFHQYLKLTLFGKEETPANKPKGKKIKPAMNKLETIIIPEALTSFAKGFNINFILTGAAVLELSQGFSPKDYDILAMDISIDQLEKELSAKNIKFDRFGKQYPILSLTLDNNIPLEIYCIEKTSHKETKDEKLKRDFNNRDFKPCAMYAEIPKRQEPVNIISFNKTLHYCNRKIIDTIAPPLECFKDDPLRLLRLIKWQIKHPTFKLKDRLNQYLQATSTSWTDLFASKNTNNDTGLPARFRTVLLQLIDRFSVEKLIKNSLFVSLLADLSHLDKNTVVDECSFIAEHSQKREVPYVFLYLVFNLYLKARQTSDDNSFPLKDHLLLLNIDNDFFNAFEAMTADKDSDCIIYDDMFQTILQRHGFNTQHGASPTNC